MSKQPAISTGVTGLDKILRGGLPPNRLYLLLGKPGVGKTTLAMQFLLEGVQRGERVMYIALSETQEEIMDVAESHGWDLSQVNIFELSALEQQQAQEKRNTVFHPSEIELGRTTKLLLDQISRVRPERLVIDSLSELRLLSDSPLRYRKQLLSLKQFFAGQVVSVFMLDDHSAGYEDLHVQSIAHGVIAIEQIISEYGADRRRLRIMKLRGVKFIGGYHDAAIEKGGLRIFPRISSADAVHSDNRAQMKCGISSLDALLGGGLERGTSCLLLGPAGVGKSTISLQFAVAAARRGEKSVLCLFEENPATLRARATSIGIPLDDLIESRLLELIEIRAADLSAGEFASIVLENVHRRKVGLVLIDSLNGYMQALPDVKTLVVQMHELLSFLNHHGVLSLLTVAQSGLVGQMHAPVELTYLADAVILLRFFEHAGRIKKAISVIKKRAGKHEDTVREFKIDSHGIQVGLPLEEFDGVLTGTPRFTGRGEQMLSGRNE